MAKVKKQIGNNIDSFTSYTKFPGPQSLNTKSDARLKPKTANGKRKTNGFPG